MTIRRAAAGLAALAPLLLAASSAHANGLEFPSNGTEQMARGSAWLARATDPLAVFYNPAALARNATAASVTVNLTLESRCFTRKGPDGGPVDINGYQLTGKSCNDASGTPFPNPQLAFNWRVSDKLGVGLAVMGPSAYGGIDFGETSKNVRASGQSKGASVEGPAGTRYMLSSLSSLLIWPQIAIGYEVAPNLRVGASLIWGVAILDLKSVALGSNGDQGLTPGGQQKENGQSDVRAQIKAKDWFVPGFVVSSLYSATPNIDIAAWYHWSDGIKATGESRLEGVLYDNRLETPAQIQRTDTPKGRTALDVPQPMEARVGVRFHVNRPDLPPSTVKDPLHDEIFDIELDGEWSHDSQMDGIGVRFTGDKQTVSIPGFSPLPLPATSNIPHKWKDTFGARLGGDYNVIPDLLAVRAGAWFQTSAIDPKYVYVDFFPTQRVGLTGGATVRVKPVDIQVGYQHIFMASVDNKGDGRIKALTVSESGQSLYGINGGKLTGSANVFSIGAVARF